MAYSKSKKSGAKFFTPRSGASKGLRVGSSRKGKGFGFKGQKSAKK